MVPQQVSAPERNYYNDNISNHEGSGMFLFVFRTLRDKNLYFYYLLLIIVLIHYCSYRRQIYVDNGAFYSECSYDNGVEETEKERKKRLLPLQLNIK